MLTQFFVRASILLLPGIVARLVLYQLIGAHNKKHWEDFAEIVIFSLVTYSLLGMVIGEQHGIVLLSEIGDQDLFLTCTHLIWASALGAVLAYIFAGIHTYKIINKIGRFLRVTQHYGDEDVWDLFHNMDDIDWVVIRDHRLDLVYYGYVKYFSDLGATRELLLKDVDVYTNTGDLLYSVGVLYIARLINELSIEVPQAILLPKEGE